jgi:hypothetical protein
MSACFLPEFDHEQFKEDFKKIVSQFSASLDVISPSPPPSSLLVPTLLPPPPLPSSTSLQICDASYKYTDPDSDSDDDLYD